MRILPLLGVNYFFYYVDKVCEQLLIQRESRFVDRSAEFAFFFQTTLSYAAIFGIKNDLKLVGTQYNWLSAIFYFVSPHQMTPRTRLRECLGLARMGHSVQPDHAKKPSSILSRREYLHVGRSPHGTGRITKFCYHRGPSSSIRSF